MTPFDPFDLAAVRSADEGTLEFNRRLLVQNGEAGCEPVIDELSHRALPIIVAEARRRADAKGLGREQLMRAVEEAATNLQMRLRSAERLDPIGELAKTLAGEAVDARAPEPPEPPRLVSRRPDLRPVEPTPEQLDESMPEEVDEPSEPTPEPADEPPAPPSPRAETDRVNDKLGDELRRNRIKRNDPENS